MLTCVLLRSGHHADTVVVVVGGIPRPSPVPPNAPAPTTTRGQEPLGHGVRVRPPLRPLQALAEVLLQLVLVEGGLEAVAVPGEAVGADVRVALGAEGLLHNGRVHHHPAPVVGVDQHARAAVPVEEGGLARDRVPVHRDPEVVGHLLVEHPREPRVAQAGHAEGVEHDVVPEVRVAGDVVRRQRRDAGPQAVARDVQRRIALR
eukprot:CAMPEP_0194715192 /NCGR_PEP_ID=MMETSP0296-20130528/6908_1 /TAXON_ID=39354 /ORGANISM="Heterosigma akashiwo, Strain CCMP2393" /LENGTH=203 /DNA_ID=CAMNT_0039614879 /DNA_START=164 /DNA_END=771 /DNA_ORIENTATION=-